MEQCIPYSFLCDLFSRNLETYLHVGTKFMSNVLEKGEPSIKGRSFYDYLDHISYS